MDRHAAGMGIGARFSSERRSGALQRGTALLVGMLITIWLSVAYLWLRWDVGFLDAGYIAGFLAIFFYLVGVLFGVAGRAMLPTHTALRIYAVAAAVTVIDVALEGPAFLLFFWAVLVPSAGAIAATVPLGEGGVLSAIQRAFVDGSDAFSSAARHEASPERIGVMLLGLLATTFASIAYSNASHRWGKSFDAGWAPAPFVILFFMVGAACAVGVRAIAALYVAFALSLSLAAIVLVALSFGGYNAVLFWYVLIPSAGAIAMTVPVGRE